ncbi:MAG TPA: hypothetical protein VE174_12690, partial [Actinomycetota bacterium]|nr:hypothetical protein [Actinomycetota bacterium]
MHQRRVRGARRTCMAISVLAALVAASTSAVDAAPVVAEDPEFSPTIEWIFCAAEPVDECQPGLQAGENPRLDIVVEQDEGEIDFAGLKVRFPRGYYLAPDRAIAGGSNLGTADLTIASGPGCAGGQGKTPFTAENLGIREQDRSAEDKKRGVRAIWVIEVLPDTNIVLELFGNPQKGIKIDHIIPANDFLCPPMRVEVHYQATADGAPIFRNP